MWRCICERSAILGWDLDIADFFKRPYGSLFAGQKTRVTLAKVPLNKLEIRLLDERAASRDPNTVDWTAPRL